MSTIHLVLAAMVSDAAIFRKDKETQRMSYLLYVILKVKYDGTGKTKPSQKPGVYWRYLS